MAAPVKSKQKMTTIGHYLLDRLHELGVQHIFGIPGDYVLRFDQLIEEHPIKFINTTRENTAGYMADAYARMQGLGVACITYGVGINITNAVSQAFVESSPVVIISGAASKEEFLYSQQLHHLFNKKTDDPRDTTQLEIFRHITCAQTVLDEPIHAAEEINRVLGACLQQKKPVYIEIPRNQVESSIPITEKAPFSFPESDPEALTEILDEVKDILSNSKRPVIWVGHELQRYSLATPLLQFAEKCRIPIASSLLGKSVISESHPLFMGLYQGKLSNEEVRDYVENADCMMLLGVSLNEVNTGIFTTNLELPKHKIEASSEVIKINHHEYKDILFSDFVYSLTKTDWNLRFHGDYPACIDRENPAFTPKNGRKITAKTIFECLQTHIKPDHVIVSDIGDCLFGSAELNVERSCYLSNAYFATLGFGVPGAIGAQIAAPQKRVIGVVGDGAFQMTCTELSTAARYGIDPIIILMNNHGYATERPLAEGKFNDVHNWQYSKIPTILGSGQGRYVTTEDELHEALQEATAKRGEFFLIEVELDKMDFSPALKRFCHLVKSRRK